MSERRERVLDAAIDLIGEGGIKALTHRGVDARASLPAGSTSNLFRTAEALLEAVVDRFAERERADWDALTLHAPPETAEQLTVALGELAIGAVGERRRVSLTRFAILVEAANREHLRDRLADNGARVMVWATTAFRLIGATAPGAAAAAVANYLSGVMLHQLANPDPDFDPVPGLRQLINALVSH
ncbi:MAG TPA: TetR/AcrR family transcriptional regulator [Propionibacterium sp.]|nr:TetR/AcrR family transcriptional regulator [Propionibacterium sp.]